MLSSSLVLVASAAALPGALASVLDRRQFPFPWCTSTTTISLDFTITDTATVIAPTSTTFATAPPVIDIITDTTTIYTPIPVPCLTGATTIPPYTMAVETPATLAQQMAAAQTGATGLGARAPTAAAVATAAAAAAAETVTVWQPCGPGEVCTVYSGIETTVVTTTTTPISTYTITPTISGTVTETFVIPTPSVYYGVNYYVYENTYHYPDKFGEGCATCGYGGGGYETSDWLNNYDFIFNGTTQDMDFVTANWPSYADLNCQLTGMPAPENCTQWTVVFQGYLAADETGNYVITASQPTDNAVFWWSGVNAYDGYTNDNVEGGYSYTQPAGVPYSVTYSLGAGEYLPLTFIWVNGAGPALNEIIITAPNGTKYPTDLNLFVPPCPNSLFVP